MPVDTKRLPVPDTSIDPGSYSIDQPSVHNRRVEQRTDDQVRPIYLKAGVTSQAKGSAYIETGNTKLICAVYGPREVRRREDWSMTGQLSVELKYATFSRARRRGHQQDSEEKDLSVMLEEALTPAVCLDKFPKARMDVFITVLEDDGSCLAHALTVASVALADAGIHMYDVVIGASLKQTGDKMLVDPSSTEEQPPKTERKEGVEDGCVTVGFMPSLHQVCALHQKGRLSVQTLAKASRLCTDTCLKVYPAVQNCLTKAIAQHNPT